MSLKKYLIKSNISQALMEYVIVFILVLTGIISVGYISRIRTGFESAFQDAVNQILP